jgi:hypothetical protein
MHAQRNKFKLLAPAKKTVDQIPKFIDHHSIVACIVTSDAEHLYLRGKMFSKLIVITNSPFQQYQTPQGPLQRQQQDLT